MMWNFADRFTPRVDLVDLVRQERAIKPFDRLLLRGYGQLEIVQGPVPALTVASHEALIDRIGSRVKDGRLVLGFDSWWDKLRQSLSTSLNRQPILYRLTVTRLSSLEIQGLARVRGRGLESETFSLRVRGLADIQLEAFKAGALVVRMEPGGRVLLNGAVDEQEVTLRGPGAYLAAGLASQTARIKIQGPGQAELNVQEQLHVRIAGPGRVTYVGAPRIEKSLIGPAVVRPASHPLPTMR